MDCKFHVNKLLNTFDNADACKKCNQAFRADDKSIGCYLCHSYFHINCAELTKAVFSMLVHHLNGFVQHV